jgi:hypothetical protein
MLPDSEPGSNPGGIDGVKNIAGENRVFAVCGPYYVEIFDNATYNTRGTFSGVGLSNPARSMLLCPRDEI